MKTTTIFIPSPTFHDIAKINRHCNGNGTLNEITSDGNLISCILVPNILLQEIQEINTCTPTAYCYEKGTNSAIILNLKSFITEIIINPSYYTNNEWINFQNGNTKELIVFLIDSITNTIVSTNIFSLQGNLLQKLRTSFEQNSKSSRDELDYWQVNTLYAHNAKENIKQSTYIGKCHRNPNVKIQII